MREALSPGTLVEAFGFGRALILSVHENKCGVFYNVMLSSGESLVVDASSVKLGGSD